MVQFWAHKEVIFVHYCVLQFVYCAVVIAEDFDAVEVCCKTVVTVLSRKFATFLGLYLLFSHVVLMFCHCVLLDEAMASWENFYCVFCFMSLLIVSKLSGVCLFRSVVPFFASRSAVSLPCIPTCEGTP